MQVDGRTLDHKTLESIRLMAVKRVLEDKESPSKVIKSYGFNRTTIYKWLAEIRWLKRYTRLRSTVGTGRPNTLTKRQKQKVKRWIVGKDPRQYGFDFGLWSRKIVAQLIQQEFGLIISVWTVGRLLAELEITPQKPLRRAYERDPVAIEKWKKEEFPRLKRRAGKANADIFFLDEAGIRSDSPLGRTWGKKGETPIVRTSSKRQSINAISALNSKGAFWYKTYTGRFNATLFINFLKDFLRTRNKKVFMVIDGHPSHKAKIVKAFEKKNKHRIELILLPAYAPELNPDELVWNHVKKNGISRKPLKKDESLTKRVEKDLTDIKNNRNLVRSFFYEKDVAYILH